MQIAVPDVLIWKRKTSLLVSGQVLKTTQTCSQTNTSSSYRAVFSILFENMQFSKKKWSANSLDYSPNMTFFKTLTRATEASFCRILACYTALEPQAFILSSYKHPPLESGQEKYTHDNFEPEKLYKLRIEPLGSRKYPFAERIYEIQPPFRET